MYRYSFKWSDRQMKMKALTQVIQIRKLNTVNKTHVNENLYRLLYSHELYVTAYENLKSVSLNAYELNSFK